MPVLDVLLFTADLALVAELQRDLGASAGLTVHDPATVGTILARRLHPATAVVTDARNTASTAHVLGQLLAAKRRCPSVRCVLIARLPTFAIALIPPHELPTDCPVAVVLDSEPIGTLVQAHLNDASNTQAAVRTWRTLNRCLPAAWREFASIVISA